MRLSATIIVCLAFLSPALAPLADSALAQDATMPDTTKMSRAALMAWRASRQGAQADTAAVEKELPPLPEGVKRITDNPDPEKYPCWSPMTMVTHLRSLRTLAKSCLPVDFIDPARAHIF